MISIRKDLEDLNAAISRLELRFKLFRIVEEQKDEMTLRDKLSRSDSFLPSLSENEIRVLQHDCNTIKKELSRYRKKYLTSLPNKE